MARKIILVLLAASVVYLGISYRAGLVQESGERLIAHAYYGELEGVKDEAERGAPLDFTLYFSDEEREYNQVEFNALHAAASGGNEDVINYLLNLGLDINAQTPDGWTPLFIAARDGHAEAAKLFIFREADLNRQTDLGATALLMAVTQPYPSEKERLDVITYMLNRGADPNLAAEKTFPPLYYAAVTLKLPVVQTLVEHGASVTPKLLEQITTYFEKHPSGEAKKIAAFLKKAARKK